jgi:hypothetical protein
MKKQIALLGTLAILSGFAAPAQAAWKDVSKNWNWQLGNSNTVAAYLNGNFKMEAEASKVKDKLDGRGMVVNGRAAAGVTAVNNSWDILVAEVNFKAPTNAAMSGYMRVKALNKTLWEVNASSLRWEKKGRISKSIDVSTTFRFTVVIIPIKVTLGIKGEVGIDYEALLTLNYAGVQVTPFLKVTGYAQAGVDLFGVAGAGVTCNLTVLDVRIPIGGSAYASIPDAKIVVSLAINTNITMLSGNVGFYAYCQVPRWGIPPWKKAEYTHTFFSWAGFKNVGTLYQQKYELKL